MHHQANCYLNYPLLSFQDKRPQESAENDLINLFNKKYQFTRDSSWRLPDRKKWFTESSWKLKELENLKCRLNFHKSQLNDFDIEEWSCHTRRRNPAGEVCWKVRCLVNPEFLTQAWTKFYECAYTFNIIPKESIANGKLVSLHLCEAPGAFITSLNHYIKQCNPAIDWKWIASTLNPYYEGNSLSNMITDDRFIFHTLDSWNFGLDNTGNLMDWENSQSTIAKARSLGKVMLVTADGSIDCLLKPDAQEETTSPLHYCEIVTALQALSPGGTLIFKLFTIFECSTVCLLYLINLLFEEVNIFKPVTSRQGNSEVYAICLNYKGVEEIEQLLPILKTAYGTEFYKYTSLFPKEVLPASFIQQIKECADWFSAMQCEVINNNIHAFFVRNNYSTNSNLKKIRGMVSTEFIRRYKLLPLDLEHEILKGVLHEENKVNNNPRFHRGSYTERQLYSRMSLSDKINSLYLTLNDCVQTNPAIFINSTYDSVEWIDIYDKETDLNLVFTYGLPLHIVNSSKFIFVPILRLYQQILVEGKFKDVVIKCLREQIQNPKIENSAESLTLPVYDYTENYCTYEKKCFKILCTKIRNMSAGQRVIVNNFDCLTHFAVSVIYILGKKFFEKIGFTTSSIIFEKLINKNQCHYLDSIQSECDNIFSNGFKDVLNFLPVQVTNTGDFFDKVVLFNNTLYKNKCINYITAIQNCI